jgi:short-subunit dehydrogenase
MDRERKGKRALVTGTTRGIGREIGEIMAGERYNLALLALDHEAGGGVERS